MKNYIVYVREIHVVPIKVEAADEFDAIEKARNCEGEWIVKDSEFQETMDSSEWSVELCSEQHTTVGRVDALSKKIDELKMMLSDSSINSELIENGISDLQEEIASITNSFWNEINNGVENA